MSILYYKNKTQRGMVHMMKMVNLNNEVVGNLYKNGNIWCLEYKGNKHRVPVLSESQAITWCYKYGVRPMAK